MNNRPKVLITGAGSGIGRATAVRFAEAGYDVCLNDIQSDKVAILLNRLPKGNHLVLPGDYSKEAVVADGNRLIRSAWSGLDVLVSCAGVFAKTDLMNMDLHAWRPVFDQMVNGAYRVSRLAAELMGEGGGRIIHVTSIHGTRAERFSSAYAMAKSAVNQLCRALSVDFAEKGILVNAIAPGFVRTAMSVVDGEDELETDWFRRNYIDGHHLPLKRAAMPEEIAGVALFLAGQDASYITGQVLNVDGGLTVTF